MDLKFSHSMRQTFCICPRKIYFTYCAGIQKKDRFSDALILGRAFHKGLEDLRNKAHFEDAITEVSKILKNSKDPNLNLIKTEAYLIGYFKYYDDLSREIKTEVSMDCYDNRGVVDCLVADGDEWIIIEDKTTSAFDENLEKFLVLNEQIPTYLMLAAENGYKVKAVMYRELQKSTHKLNKGETVTDFTSRIRAIYWDDSSRYRQIVINPNIYDISKHIVYINEINTQIESYIENIFDSDIHSSYKNTSACLGKYGPCEFLDICSKNETNLSENFECNNRDPFDGGKYRHNNEIYLSEFGDKFDLDQFGYNPHHDFDGINPDLLARFIMCFDCEKTKENIEKIIAMYDNRNGFEIKSFIKQKGF